MSKYICPPQSPSGAGTFSDALVGLQTTQGGGLTLANFAFTNKITEKVNRNFDTGVFSDPITLSDLNITSTAQAQKIYDVNFKVYPNFDETNILNFVAYGPLNKRFSSAVINIINYFPAALEVSSIRNDFTNGTTATNISYNEEEDITNFSVDASVLRNPFSINFTKNSTQILKSLEFEVSKYRNLTVYFTDYILKTTGGTFGVVNLTATTSTSAGTLSFSVLGNPFGTGVTETYEDIVIRPNDYVVNEVFNLELDEVEELLLNRYSYPIYTSKFKILKESDDGSQFIQPQSITWPLNGSWNIDIQTPAFTYYLKQLDTIGQSLDEYQTDILNRFYTTDSLKEFDTPDQKVQKTLKLYGRSFDETKKYIDSISHMVSVNYIVGDDIPDKLLPNLAQTLGWSTNISPIQNNSFFSTIYETIDSEFPGQATSPTLDELQNQYYRSLILNSGYLFRSKGTRKAIEFLLNFIGAPEALIDFNEYIYLADDKIPLTRFNEFYSTILGGTYRPQVVVYDPLNIYKFNGVQYTAFTTSTSIQDVTLTINDFPIDSDGYPKMITESDSFFFQKGAGWFESTPQHRSPEIIDTNLSTFTGQNIDVQTALEPFTYGEKYLDRYRNFPYLGIGFELLKTIDNKKSWSDEQLGLRKNADGNFDAYYEVSNDKLVLNVKNVDLFLNPGQALVYDVWYLSNTKSYPIPITGLSSPYPQTGGTDWTVISPKPQQKDFFEFKETFWKNMINVRNRQQSSDGKTSGYPTLQSIFWKYLTMYQDTGIQNDGFTYGKMIEYINGIGDYWIRLVEQFVPATTIWNTGTRIENSIFHRQKFVYRPQRGCLTVQIPIEGPSGGGSVDSSDCNGSKVSILVPLRGTDLLAEIQRIEREFDCTQPGDLLPVFGGTVKEISYCFDLTITRNNPPIGLTSVYTTQIFCTPTSFTLPNIIPTTDRWQDFITQGVNYLSVDLAQQGLSILYDPENDIIFITSEVCDDLTRIDFNLTIKVIKIDCSGRSKGGGTKGGGK
jgi:hypothetical protein